MREVLSPVCIVRTVVVHPHHPSISDPQPPVSEEKTVPTHPMHRELSLILKEIKVGTSICKILSR